MMKGKVKKMAKITFNRESIERVRLWIASYKTDISSDIADIQADNSEGIVMKDDSDELEVLSGVLTLLSAFESVLTGVEKGGVN